MHSKADQVKPSNDAEVLNSIHDAANYNVHTAGSGASTSASVDTGKANKASPIQKKIHGRQFSYRSEHTAMELR
ncbi:hypothetical protein Tco_0658436 [Tanacetum coccineum]